MKKQYKIIGKLPTKPNKFNFGIIKLGKEGDKEITLGFEETYLSSAEQTLRWYVKKGCTECRIEETTELTEDHTISVGLSGIS